MTRKATSRRNEVPDLVPDRRGRARRTRSPHPGVVLIRPDETHASWRARYRDPDSQKMKKEALPGPAGRTAETRRAWAIRRSQEITRRGLAIEGGAPRATGTLLGDAIERYYRDHPRLRPATIATYRKGTRKFLEWAATRRIEKSDVLTLATLTEFASWLSAKPRMRAESGRKRGAKVETTEHRAASAVNVEIRSVKAVLRYLHAVGLLARLSRDDIAYGLRPLKVPREAPEFLRGAEIGALLEAARAHDAETYAATRAELKGQGAPGTTPRYDPIYPLVRVVLLTGMRAGEAIDLDWSEVDMQAQEIRLGTRTKTKHARSIPFDHAPSLAETFRALGPRAHGSVFRLTEGQAKASARRLTKYGAPQWTWQMLRRTCGTYLTNAPGIFGAASAYHSARRLGHSVAVAEKHYVGVVRGIPADAKTLEAAMGLGGAPGQGVT